MQFPDVQLIDIHDEFLLFVIVVYHYLRFDQVDYVQIINHLKKEEKMMKIKMKKMKKIINRREWRDH